MTWTVGIICIVAGVLVVINTISLRRRLRPILNRGCTGREWRRKYPAASKNEIRQFLRIFADAFSFRRKQILAFSPSDQIMAIYRVIYPPTCTPVDSFELETFDMKLSKRYGLELLLIWREDLTLGEVFEKVKTA